MDTNSDGPGVGGGGNASARGAGGAPGEPLNAEPMHTEPMHAEPMNTEPMHAAGLLGGVRLDAAHRDAAQLDYGDLVRAMGAGSTAGDIDRGSDGEARGERRSDEKERRTVKGDVDVELPVRTVYDQWTRFEDFPAFMSGVDEVTQLADATMHWKVRVGGVEREFDVRVAEQIPDQRIAWKSTSGPGHAGVVTFHRLDDERTKVRLRLDWSPQGLVEKVGAALQIDDAQVAADLRRFRQLMETNGFATGAWRGTIERTEG